MTCMTARRCGRRYPPCPFHLHPSPCSSTRTKNCRWTLWFACAEQMRSQYTHAFTHTHARTHTIHTYIHKYTRTHTYILHALHFQDQHYGRRYAAHPALRGEGIPNPSAHAARVSASISIFVVAACSIFYTSTNAH